MRGDTKTVGETLKEVQTRLDDVRTQLRASKDKAKAKRKKAKRKKAKRGKRRLRERVKAVVADAGYHSNDVLWALDMLGIRSYIAEPRRGRRNWKGKPIERALVYANRRRVKGRKGKMLMRARSQQLERPFAHMHNSGAMRRVHVRGRGEVRKRVLLQAAAFNMGLLMRKLFGVGTPRRLQGGGSLLFALLWWLLVTLGQALGARERKSAGGSPMGAGSARWCARLRSAWHSPSLATEGV